MKEYTLFAAVSVFCTVLLDKLLKSRLFIRAEFWVFLSVIAVFKLAVNGYLTATNIVVYNPSTFLGIRLGSIPLEDFLFGFSMVSMTIIFWEFFKKEGR